MRDEIIGNLSFFAPFLQPHLAQCYSFRIALIVNGVHESKIYFAVQLGVNKLVSGGSLEGENIHHASRCFLEQIFHTEV